MKPVEELTVLTSRKRYPGGGQFSFNYCVVCKGPCRGNCTSKEYGKQPRFEWINGKWTQTNPEDNPKSDPTK